MLKLILSRLGQGVVVLLTVSVLTFALLAAAGGDALTAMRSDPLVSEQTIESLRRIYGLEEPLALRYVRWLARVVRGDLGYSFFFHTPVSDILWARLLNTLLLASVALLLAWTVALALGQWAARRRGSWVDRLSGALVLLAASTPRLVLALFALVIAARTTAHTAGPEATAVAGQNISRLLWPAVVLAVPLVSLFLAQTREGVRAALAEDYVQVARAKGLPERVVIMRHALRAALNPLITIFGYSLGSAISGSVIVETVLGWPGLGQLSVIAVRSRDVPLLMAVVLITSTAVLVGNLLADVLQRINDPRLRDEDERPRAASAANVSVSTTPAA